MKRIIAVFIALILLSTATTSWAKPLDFAGGVNNEYEYEEIVFLTGKPVNFIGEVKVTEKEKDNELTVSYKFDLVPEDKSIEGSLKRTISYKTLYTPKNDKGQTIGQTELTKYSEKIIIDGDTFELKDYQLSHSEVIDQRPASDFYSGSIKGRKYYTVNKNQGSVTLNISGGDVGYENFWGSTETQLLNYTLNSTRNMAEDSNDTITWEGTVDVQVSDSLVKNLKYSDNQANLSSFDGGYIKTTSNEIVSRYEYNLPKMNGDEPNKKARNRGSISLSKNMVPKVERLVVPKFRDLGGHWAESQISKLYSLEVFDEVSQFFTPDIPISRLEFTKAVMKACNIRPTMEEKKKTTSSRRKKEVEESPFIDISTEDENYPYIKEAYEKGIAKGELSGKFEPERSLSKAEAVSILIRALGFENRAPAPGYYFTFSDGSQIPAWAKDSIYVARELGIIQGDNANNISPNKQMSRAEASSMLVRFLEFLEKDLQKDYRENIINY
ncbi:S-layer homology domain-containing protein [Proteiniborus sp. MB09-C3]|uniref:S-layer homology domain-containing protein n=1 Tax=Proteiniborus sp. MB09-C3 TaxID=3050072 RepID=UPI0025539090|nr:S-layer homology domain-containing protein [Proteiniborus sp. MB09-C3]WIV12249.1 S-layer homology domain-containing protein [Proteiniborus sp. MB09-C3]